MIVLLGLTASPALAAPGVGVARPPLAVFGIDFPSVKEIVGDVVRFFFSTFLDALVPDWLKDAGVAALKRLVTVPNPADARAWPTIARLSEGVRWVAIPLLSLAVVVGWMQQWMRELTGRPAALGSVLARAGVAALLLVSYPVFFGQVVALVNSVSDALLSLPVVAEGLERSVGLVFAGSLLSGSGLLLALLGIATILLAVGLFMLSTGLLVLWAVLYVAAPLAIVCSVVDETRGVWRAWRYALLSTALVPIGWCLLFATSGAFMVDVTGWPGGIGGQMGAKFVGVFAALITLWLAVRWPLMLWGTIRTQIAGSALSAGSPQSAAGGGPITATGSSARAALQRTSVRAGDAIGGVMAGTRRTAAAGARMALADGARVAMRASGARAAATVAAPLAAGAAGAAARIAGSTASGRAREAASAVHGRAQAAAASGKRAIVHGASTRAAGAAALEAAARAPRAAEAERPGRPKSPGAGASQQQANRGDTALPDPAGRRDWSAASPGRSAAARSARRRPPSTAHGAVGDSPPSRPAGASAPRPPAARLPATPPAPAPRPPVRQAASAEPRRTPPNSSSPRRRRSRKKR